MKLSMHIISNWLNEYNPETRIEDRSMKISTVQLLNKNSILEDGCIYVGYAYDILNTSDKDQRIACKNNSDVLILECEDSNLIVNSILNAFAYYNQWEADLKDAVFQHKSFQEFIDIAYPVFECPMELFTLRGDILGITSQYVNITSYFDESINTGKLNLESFGRFIHQTPGIEKFIEEKMDYAYFCWAKKYTSLLCRIRFQNSVACTLALYGYNKELTEADRQLAKVFTGILVNIDENDSVYSKIRPAATVFKKILNHKEVSDDEIKRTLFELNWGDKTSWNLVIVDNLKNSNMSAQLLDESFSKEIEDCIAFDYNEKNILIMPEKKCTNTVEYAINALYNNHYASGISLPFTDWNNLPSALKQAETAIQYGEENKINHCSDYVWQYLLDFLSEKCNEFHMIHPDVLTLSAHDKEHNTELVRTLHSYLRNKSKIAQTSKELYIHSNTLKYRINKIKELTDINLDTHDLAAHVLLSCEIIINRDKTNL